MQKYINAIQDYISNMRTLICVLGVMCIFTSCRWHEAKEVIITADSLDQNEHVLYDDTLALRQTIRTLDNPLGRLFAHNQLGKAHTTYLLWRYIKNEKIGLVYKKFIYDLFWIILGIVKLCTQ